MTGLEKSFDKTIKECPRELSSYCHHFNYPLLYISFVIINLYVDMNAFLIRYPWGDLILEKWAFEDVNNQLGWL